MLGLLLDPLFQCASTKIGADSRLGEYERG